MLLSSRLKLFKQPTLAIGFFGYFFVPSISFFTDPQTGYGTIFILCGIVFAICMMLSQTQIAIRARACYPVLPPRRHSLLGDTLATIALGAACTGLAFRLGMEGHALPLLYASLFNLAWLLTQARSSRPKFVVTGFHIALVVALLASAPFKTQLIEFADQVTLSGLVAAALLPIGATLIMDPVVIKNWIRLHRAGLPPVYSNDTKKLAEVMHSRKNRWSPKQRIFPAAQDSVQQRIRNTYEASTGFPRAMRRPGRLTLIYILGFLASYLALYATSTAMSSDLQEPLKAFNSIGFIAMIVPMIGLATYTPAELSVFLTRLGRAECFRFTEKLILRSATCLSLALLVFFPALQFAVHYRMGSLFTWFDFHTALLGLALTLVVLAPAAIWQFSVLQLKHNQTAPLSGARLAIMLAVAIPMAFWFGFSSIAFTHLAQEKPDTVPLYLAIEAAALIATAAFSWLWLVPRSRKRFLRKDL
ncbi:hypothetical protein [Pelagicoccus sp. SDUM812003]|uniref:hypothetical protein n=1 Tax=Pelagicoccus sp. SDUM812003 TaxID=3041267 RepID=UPI00280FD6F3|nr:hypothetical protein [Pelagicoccus sp. SDUM812003]MDQ8203555.1 hypothetical protein [Pelagicoccus sp. SDUM812003]